MLKYKSGLILRKQDTWRYDIANYILYENVKKKKKKKWRYNEKKKKKHMAVSFSTVAGMSLNFKLHTEESEKT